MKDELTENHKDLIQFIEETAFEFDDGYKVRIYIDWDKLKPKLKKYLNDKDNITQLINSPLAITPKGIKRVGEVNPFYDLKNQK